MCTIANRFNDMFFGQEIIELKADRIEDLINYQDGVLDFGKYTFCRIHLPSHVYNCILICTRFANMVVYQNTIAQQGSVSYVCDKRLDYTLGFEDMTLNYNEFNRVFHPTENVGIWLENIARMIVSNEN